MLWVRLYSLKGIWEISVLKSPMSLAALLLTGGVYDWQG